MIQLKNKKHLIKNKIIIIEIIGIINNKDIMLPYSTTYATLIRLITCSKYCDLSAATWYSIQLELFYNNIVATY